MVQLAIGICYGVTALSFFYLARVLWVTPKIGWIVKATAIGLAIVFVFCGGHYSLLRTDVWFKLYWDRYVLLPFAVALAGLMVTTVILYADKIKQNAKAFQEVKEQSYFLKLIEENNLSNLALCQMLEDKKDLRVLWYTRSFYDWTDHILDKELPKSLIDRNWYEIFPITKKWKQDHSICINEQRILRDNCEHWQEKDCYLKWVIIPVDDDKILFSFEDVTKVVKKEIESEEQKRELIRQNKMMIQAGLSDYSMKKMEE